MPLPTITPADFDGWIKIPSYTSDSGNSLEDYILDFYQKYAREIIGDAAYIDAENNDLPKWNDLFNGINYLNSTTEKNARCDGLVSAIKKFIYFQFIRDNFDSTQTGLVEPNNENSQPVGGGNVVNISMSRYNSGVLTVNGNVLDFLKNFETITEEITGFTDNADNTYTIQVASTLYLVDGDTVTIEGNDYVISGLIENTSFVIDFGSIGESFSGDAIWKPYDLVDYELMSPATFV